MCKKFLELFDSNEIGFMFPVKRKSNLHPIIPHKKYWLFGLPSHASRKYLRFSHSLTYLLNQRTFSVTKFDIFDQRHLTIF